MMAHAVFGGGCFWCTEAVFQMLRGVSKVESGYAGGPTRTTGSGQVENPTYEQVSAGNTGHAEVIRVTYDPAVISYKDLLTVFFGSHDPTTPNKQGADVGEQYRSVIFYDDDSERATAEEMIREIDISLSDGTRVVTQVVPAREFYPAESYHKDYYRMNVSAPYCQLIIEPKLEKVRERFSELVDHEKK